MPLTTTASLCWFLVGNSLGMLLLRGFSKRRFLSLGARAGGQEGADAEYNQTLDELFRAVKNPSRHVESPDELFAQRRGFFQRVFTECGLQARRPVVVHVAGSKGKGSTVEYISSGLGSQGHRVGIFTSPHLHTARERIKIGRSLVSKADLTRLGQSSLASMRDLPWTVFFDLLLTTALRYFGEQEVDYLVLEAGIGGRYDSTNFLPSAPVGVITSISLDHQALLGDTIEEIAWQKAGIIKPGMHLFTASSQQPSVLEVFRKACDAVGATLHEVAVDANHLAAAGILMPSRAPYSVQIQNACLSLAVVRHLGLPAAGMNDFFWPCRMETFVVDAGPREAAQVPLILDGCHNGDSVDLFISGLRSRHPGKRVVLLFGAGMDKSLDEMLGHLASLDGEGRVVLVQSRHFRALGEGELHALAARVPGLAPLCEASLPPLAKADAGTVGLRLGEALRQAGLEGNTVVAVCGSLFAASEAREWLYDNHPGLFSKLDWVRERDL